MRVSYRYINCTKCGARNELAITRDTLLQIIDNDCSIQDYKRINELINHELQFLDKPISEWYPESLADEERLRIALKLAKHLPVDKLYEIEYELLSNLST